LTLLEEASISEILQQMKEELERHIEARISGRSDKFLIERAIAKGKRLRPLLLLATFKALGGKDYSKALDVACALELAHSASLVHDDIIDLDHRRRGGMALWDQIGVGKAVLQGHRIINFAFETVLEKGLDLADIFLRAWDKASKGIMDEILISPNPSKPLYMYIIREKTASLFEAATESAAVLAGAGPELKKIVKQLGLEVGTAYQLADDLAEMLKSKGSTNVYLILQQAKQRFTRAFVASNTGSVDALLRAISPRMPTVKFLIREIGIHVRAAEALCMNPLLPDTSERRLLRNLPLYFVKQILREAM